MLGAHRNAVETERSTRLRRFYYYIVNSFIIIKIKKYYL